MIVVISKSLTASLAGEEIPILPVPLPDATNNAVSHEVEISTSIACSLNAGTTWTISYFI